MENLVNMEFLNYYKGKRVMITGHTGFKGAWLSIWLHLHGAEVYGYALDSLHKNGVFVRSGIGKLINDNRGDIRDLQKLKNIFKKAQPEIVFHLAAQPIVLESYKNPVETFEINTQGTVNVLEAIRLQETVGAAVMITTDKCYDNKEWVWGYREIDPMGGHDPYSASKGAAELIIASYRKSFFNEPNKAAIVSARAGNVIGGGDWGEYRLIPDIFRAIENDKEIIIRNPASTRPWQHVLEPLSGYLLLGARLNENKEKYSGAWNFGPYMKDIHPVRNVVDEIIKIRGKGRWKDESAKTQLHEAKLLMLDISKASHELNWHPVLNFHETIKFTVDWYMNYTNSDVLTFTESQIKEYQRKWSLRKEN